jgi:cell division ATPase FtsA
MGILANSKRDELALVFDIGSSSVGGALFWMQKSGVPKIIYSIREPIILELNITPERFLFLTLKAFKVVASKVCTKGLGAPKRIFCVLSSPWYASQSRTIKLEKNTPFNFTTKLAESLTEKEVKFFEEEHQAIYNNIDSKVRPIEFRNMKTMLNGYPTSKPINQKASELEMKIFLSMSPEKVLQKIEEIVARHFHRTEVRFSSFLMTSFSVARDMFVHQDNFLLVDIGGEVTDISMIKKDVICESISFPMGRNFIIRETAKSLGCGLDEAKSLISLYKDGHAAESTEKILTPVISKLKAEWLRNFQESLAHLSTDISIPATIFITVDQDFANFFSETIKVEQFSQYTLTESKFRVIFLGTETLHGIVLFEENIVRDPFLIIESIYINRFLR